MQLSEIFLINIVNFNFLMEMKIALTLFNLIADIIE